MRRDTAMRSAGITALATAAYHGIKGAGMVNELELAKRDHVFVFNSFQLGTMGWASGAVLLLGASRIDSVPARSLIGSVMTVLYGVPAFGTLTLTRGRPSMGGAALLAASVLAFHGRRLDDDRLGSNDRIGLAAGPGRVAVSS